jgi:prophage regulatory protein
MQDKYIRRTQVEEVTGLGRSTIYEMMSKKRFPLPIRIGSRAVRWSENEIKEWLATRPITTIRFK